VEQAIAVFKDGGNGGRDDDDLLAQLDAALDEIEEEARIEAVREVAAPSWDVDEIFAPSIEMSYRGIIDGFLGRRSRDLPRPEHRRSRRLPARDPDLSELLGASMARARSSLEKRRAKVWVCSRK
jgi:hypothetical protein